MTVVREGSGKPNVLFVSRIFPAETGGGTPMRAGMTLRALAEDFRVYLLVAPLRRDPKLERIAAPLAKLCAGIAVREARDGPRLPGEVLPLDLELPAPRHIYQRCFQAGQIDDWSGCFPGVRFAAVHVMKLYMAPFVDRLIRNRPIGRRTCTLDLDDFESKTRSRIAELYEQVGDEARARLFRLESKKYAVLERAWMPLFDSVYVCSSQDRQEILAQQICDNVAVLPNAVMVPRESLPPKQGGPFTFLFVGLMAYFPNEEGAIFFVRQILPLLRRKTAKPFRVLIAGDRPSPDVQALGAEPEVSVEGWAPDVTPWYARADAVIAPIRAGGGTRIKILEAFSYRKPVIATPLAAEGLEVHKGREIWMAELPRDFAERCVEVLERPEEARRIADNAFEWVKAHGSFPCFREALLDGRRSRSAAPGAAQFASR